MRKKLSTALSENKMTLIMSMPVNDTDVMRAALDAGADVVKVHVNLLHHASGNSFGSLRDNEKVLHEMLQMTDAPMGVVLGADAETVRGEMEALRDFDFSFLSLYGHHAPLCVRDIPQELMAAADGTYSMDEVRAFRYCGAKILEASIMPGSEYGMPLTFRDLCKYRALTENTFLPVVVPTQRRVLPQDVHALHGLGVKGLMVGAVVTGESAKSVFDAVSAFRKAIDEL